MATGFVLSLLLRVVKFCWIDNQYGRDTRLALVVRIVIFPPLRTNVVKFFQSELVGGGHHNGEF